MDKETLARAIYNHLVVPARLPANGDAQAEQLQVTFFHLLIRTMNTVIGFDPWVGWTHLCPSLTYSACLIDSPTLNIQVLSQQLNNLNTCDFLLLNIRQQNAAVLLFKEYAQEHMFG